MEQPETDRASKPWLDMLEEAETSDATYHEKCDKIDKLYADLKGLAEGSSDRQFQIFWANVEVLKPTVYTRAPVPLVSPRFRDRKPLPRAAADMLERALATDVEIDRVHDKLLLIRDDLVVNGRGVAWVDFTMRRGAPAPVLRHLCRQDWRCSPARSWEEVEWVAKRAWMTRKEVQTRFGDIPEGMKFDHRDLGRDDEKKTKGAKKAEVWELWHQPENVVVWVTPGADTVLDIQEPWLQLDGFFPCPPPATATLQRDTLIPIPDVLFYKDQIEEINDLTARIGALADGLKVRGFYAGGQGDLAEAVERAMKNNDDRAVMVPVASFAALGGASLRDSIVWLPLEVIAATITQLVALRQQLIADVYEITGLSDIMRGNTAASETATAQQIKSQYGAIRAQQRQQEMQRIARDVFRLKAEIMAEACEPQQLLEWSQVDDLPTQQDIQAQAMQMMQAAKMQAMQAEQQQPGAGQQMMQQAQAQVQALQNTVTVEAVMAMFREQRTRPFILEIETDSTIQPNDNEEKQRRVEFVGAISGFMQQAIPAMAQAPQLGAFLAETLRFAASGFRAGRAMDTAIDELAEQMQNPPQQQQGPSPEEVKAQADMQRIQMEGQLKAQEMQMKMQELQLKAQTQQAKAEADAQMTQAAIAKITADVQKVMAGAYAATVKADATVKAAEAAKENADG